MNKTKQPREGTLPDYLSVDKVLVVESLQHLLTKVSFEKINELVQMIGFQGDVQVSEPQIKSHREESTWTTTKQPAAHKAAREECTFWTASMS